MPTPTKGPYLKLYAKPGRKVVWVIRDKQSWRSTGCARGDREGAERALKKYLAQTFTPNTQDRSLDKITIAEVLVLYARWKMDRPNPSMETIRHHLKPLGKFWGSKTLADIRESNCEAYSKFRTDTGRTESTARRELKTLSAAIGKWKRASGMAAAPTVTLPADGPRRERFLEREEVSGLLRACRRLGHCHVARFILIGLYTGTRHDAILKLGWSRSLGGGHVDLNRGILYRRCENDRETSKRRPPVRLTARLHGHLKRWALLDSGNRIISYDGKPILKMKRAWNTVVREAGLGRDVTPHCLKHSYVTWRLWDDDSMWDIARDTGTSVKMLEDHYGHHRPIDGRTVRGFKPLHHRNPERQEKRA